MSVATRICFAGLRFLAVSFSILPSPKFLTILGTNSILLKLVFFFLCFNLVTILTAGHGQQFIYSGFADTGIILNGLATVTPNGLLHLTNGSA